MNVAGGAAAGAFKVNSLTGLDQSNATDGIVRWDPHWAKQVFDTLGGLVH